MIKKLQLLLSASDINNRDKIDDILSRECKSINNNLPNLQFRRAIRVPDDPTASVPQDGQPDDLPEQPPFDNIIELRSDDASYESLIDAIHGIGEKLGSLIDASKSAALIGDEHVIVSGSEPLFLNMVLRRPLQWSREDWHEHWLDHHAADVRENVSGLQGYRQFHADEEFSEKAANSAGVDIFDFEGTAEGYYSDIEKFLETLSDPEVAKDTGFIDHSRSVMWLYNLYE